MNKSIYILLLLLPLFTQCITQKTNSSKMAGYEYIDGSGNKYTITSTTITYDPMTPERSSSGTYSGGEPYTVNIEEKNFNDLKLVFKKCIDNKTGQTSERNKGTGMLIVLPERITYIFEMNSPQKKEIEDAIYLASHR